MCVCVRENRVRFWLDETVQGLNFNDSACSLFDPETPSILHHLVKKSGLPAIHPANPAYPNLPQIQFSKSSRDFTKMQCRGYIRKHFQVYLNASGIIVRARIKSSQNRACFFPQKIGGQNRCFNEAFYFQTIHRVCPKTTRAKIDV